MSDAMTVFFDALGAREGTSPVYDLIAHIGVAFDFTDPIEGEFSYIFSKRGAEVVFADHLVVMVTVVTVPEGEFAAWTGEMVTGLDPRASRAEVMNALGTPERVGEDGSWARFTAGPERYIHVEFDTQDRARRWSALDEAL